MVFLSKDKIRSEKDDRCEENSKSVARSNSRRARVYNPEIAAIRSSPCNNGTLNPPKKRVSTRRSIVSLVTKSVESQMTKYGAARASNSYSTQRLSPQASPTSPTQWRTSHPSRQSLESVSSVEDLSTYHTNLARFKTERAERVAELGLEVSELSRTDSSGSGSLLPKDEQGERASGLNLNRGLRAYWGGGSTSGSTINETAGKLNKGLNLTFDEKADREALKDWWDRLGTEAIDAPIMYKVES